MKTPFTQSRLFPLSHRVRCVAVVIAAAGLIVVSGCAGPYRATMVGQKNIYKTDKVILLDRGLDPLLGSARIKVLQADFSTNGDGFPQVRLELANNRGKPTSMELRTVFKDSKGLSVHVTAWQPAVVPANATYSYLTVSPEKSAVDYQVQIKSLE